MLAVSDFHGQTDGINYLKEFLERDYDLLILLGDITQFGPTSEAVKILESIDEVGISTLAIPGNCDPEETIKVLEDKDVNLHLESRELGELTFVGLGGSNITPFGTPFELPEPAIQKKLKKLTQGIEKDWILATHAPPHIERKLISRQEVNTSGAKV